MIAQRLSALRALMQQHGIDAYIIPSADAHQSEYVASHWRSREWISGFTGSAGTVVVTADKACLWTDGRYYIQAEKQISGTEYIFFKAGTPGVPTYQEWLADTLQPNATVGFDGRTFAVSEVRALLKQLRAKKPSLKADLDCIGMIWTDRPSLPKDALYEHEVKYAGETTIQKLTRMRDYMQKKGMTRYIITTLDDIAWLYNLRGGDIPSTPVFYAYTVIGLDTAWLFTDTGKISTAIRTRLQNDGVTLFEYATVDTTIRTIGDDERIGCDPDKLNYLLEQSLPASAERFEEYCQVILMKSPKNDTEIANLRNCYIKDCVALEKFFFRLETAVKNETVTEVSAEKKLLEFRKEQPLFIEPSFNPISAYRANAAMMHYRATESEHAVLKPEHLYLLDSGGQYHDGTTDITRTVALGPLTEEEKFDFTLVVKAVINLTIARFVYGSTGTHLDILARRPLWEHGIDYKCGTGHGVGMLGNVHEAPQRFVNNGVNTFKLEEGMVITNEPGVYKAGKHGIRTENSLLVQKDEFTEYGGQFMRFETLTFCHIDTAAIIPDMLSDVERTWLNNYHKEVYAKLSPYMNDAEKEWLKGKTKAV